MKTRKSKSFSANFITYAMVIIAFLLCELALSGAIPGFKMSRSLKGQLIPICAYIVMALSLNLTVGISGELSLGHAGFMSVGAFSGILVSQWLLSAFPESNLELVRLLAALATGGVVAAIAGVLIGIPVLRLRGDYLAIVTLAFGEIIKELMNCLLVGFDHRGLHVIFNLSGTRTANDLRLAEGGTVIIKGAQGASGTQTIATFTAGFVLIMITLVIILNLVRSRTGRAIMAIRDNRIAAESCGINVTKYKLTAFIISAALAGAAGALYGLNYSNLVATKFNFNTSILVLVFVVLGGLGNMWGSIISAALLYVLPELLRQFQDYRMLTYAIVLILVMLSTNSPAVKSFLARFKPKMPAPKKKQKEAIKND